MVSGYFWRIWAVLLVLSIFWLGWALKTSQPAEAQLDLSAEADVLETISAREFRLADDQGETRAMLAIVPGVGPGLFLSDAQGKARAVLSVSADGTPWLDLRDAQGKIRAVLNLSADGTPRLGLSDAQGKVRAMFNLSTDGTPELDLLDAEGRALFSAP